MRVDVIGAHRGGQAFTHSLLDGRGEMLPLQVKVLDAEPGRPQELAALWRRHGHAALAQVVDVRQAALQPTEVRVLCLDDATALLHLIQNPMNERLLQWGLLVSTNEAGRYGGRVLGFGATLAEGDAALRSEAQALLRRLAALVGERESSDTMRTPLLNLPQMDRVRRALHQQLAADATAFLNRRSLTSHLWVAEPTGAEGRLFPLRLERRAARSREQMRQTAVQAAAETREDLRAVAFMEDRRLDWLYLVFLRPRRTRRPPVYEVEFAVELPESPATTALAHRVHDRSAASAGIHATD